jgi:hypothetical protein
VNAEKYWLVLLGRLIYGLGGESVYVGIDILTTKWCVDGYRRNRSRRGETRRLQPLCGFRRRRRCCEALLLLRPLQ